MLQIHNFTEYEAGVSLLYDPDGVDTAYVVLKATFCLDRPSARPTEPLPIFHEDVYWGDPQTSSVRYPNDVTLKKRGTDIILVGSACAPAGKWVSETEVSLRVGAKSKAVAVLGDRVWESSVWGVRPSQPKPYERMLL